MNNKIEYIKDITWGIIIGAETFIIKDLIYDDVKEMFIFTYAPEEELEEELFYFRWTSTTGLTSLIKHNVGEKLKQYGIEIPFSVILE